MSAALGFYGQARVNVPMMLVLRRTNTMFALVAEYLFIGRTATRAVFLSCVLTVLGALVAGYRDLTFDGPGYSLVCLQNVATTASTISMFFVSRKFQLSGGAMTFIMSIFSLPWSLGWAFATDAKAPLDDTLPFFFLLVVLGTANMYCSTMSVTQHSPLTTSIAGNFKDIFQTIIGAILFHDYIWHWVNFIGILFSFIGCSCFIFAKMQPQKVD